MTGVMPDLAELRERVAWLAGDSPRPRGLARLREPLPQRLMRAAATGVGAGAMAGAAAGSDFDRPMCLRSS